MRVNSLQPVAGDASAHIQNVYNELQAILIDVGPINVSLTAIADRLREQAVLADALESNISGIEQQHEGNFSDAVAVAEATLSEVEQVSRDIDLSLTQARAYQAEAERLVVTYDQIIANLSLISENANTSEQQLAEVRERKDYAVVMSSELASVVASIESILALAATTVDVAEELLTQTWGFIFLVRDDIDMLNMLIGEEVDSSDIGSGSGSGSGSGLGLGLGASMAPDSPSSVSTILEGVASLQSVVSGLESTLAVCAEVADEAEQHSVELEQQAADIQR